MSRASLISLSLAGLLTVAAACGGKKPVVTNPTTPPSGSGQSSFPGTPPAAPVRPPQPSTPPPEPTSTTIPADPVIVSDPLANADTDTINREGPLAPVFYAYDSDSVDAEGQRVLTANAAVLKKYPTWVVTIEGHSDERGTAEYNLALGERRALAVKSYLLSLGISADRLRTVSYGEEFPFDPGHDESAFKMNRRGHFVVTAK